MGALDELLARDEDNLRRAQGGGGSLDLNQLLAMDEARNLPSQDPGDGSEETPSFVGYDPNDISTQAKAIQDGEEPGIVDKLLNGPAQQWSRDYQAQQNAQGVHPENALRPADAYMGLMGGPLKAAEGAGLLGRAAASVGSRVIEGGAQGAVSGVRDVVDDDQHRSISEMAKEVLRQSGIGAGANVVLGAAGDAAGAVGKTAGRMADRWRNVVAGGNAADAKAAAKVYGLDAIDDPGRLLEKYSPSPALGMDSQGHARVVQGKLAESGKRLGDMVSEAEQLGLGAGAPAVDANVAGKLRQEAADMMRRARSPDDVAEAKAFAESAGLIGAAEPAQSLRDVINNKSRLQSQGHVGKAGTVPEKATAQANASAGSHMRDELHGIMSGSPRNQDYLDENQTYSELATLNKSLTDKAGGEQSGGAPAVLASALAGGAVAGGGALLTGHDPWEAAGMAAGGAAITGTNSAARQMLGTRGADIDANMMRALQGLGGGAQRALPAMRGAAIDKLEQSSEPAKKPGADVAVGHSKVGELLKTNPAALGGFASMLQDSADDPLKLSAAISNLARKQPMFRKLLRELEDQPDAPGSRPQSGITYSLEGE